MGLRKINTIGIKQANKVMHLAACAYNLKKLLKFVKTDRETMVGIAQPLYSVLKAIPQPFSTCITLHPCLSRKKDDSSAIHMKRGETVSFGKTKVLLN